MAKKQTEGTEKNITLSNPKIGKNKMLIGALILFVGITLVMTGAIKNITALMIIGSVIIVAGLVILAIGSFQNWYHWK
jgi:uncharacterized membrane protein